MAGEKDDKDEKAKELEQERKELKGELDQELAKSKEYNKENPFDWLVHLVKSIMLTFQLMFLPEDKAKKEEDKKKEESFAEEEPPVEQEKTELSDSKMLSSLGAQPKPKVTSPVPIVPLNMDPDDEEEEDLDEEEENQQDVVSSPFAIPNPLSTKLKREK